MTTNIMASSGHLGQVVPVLLAAQHLPADQAAGGQRHGPRR